MTGTALMRVLARRYRLRRAGAALVFAVGILALGAAIALHLVPAAGAAIVAVASGAAAATAIGAVRRSADSSDIARHMDRLDPALGESAELLLRDDVELTLAERLARRTAEAAAVPGEWRLRMFPDRTATRLASAGAVALAGALAVALWPEAVRSGVRAGAGGPALLRPTIGDVRIEVSPPAYLGLRAQTQRMWDIDAPDGALVTWSIAARGAVGTPRLVTSRGDTLQLTASGGRLGGSLRVRESAIYQILFAGGGSDFHRLTVRADGSPVVSVLRPAPRSRLEARASRVVPLDVLVRDDHGISAAEVVATVTSGQGESVRFRERRFALPARRETSDGTHFTGRLDLDTLGMAPGDELYFHVVARDNRRPPNAGRSETVFIAIADTGARAQAEFAGLALGAGPEYFRSQRQIILDTERLIADAPKLPTEIFRERSNAIGMDQGLLRLRYGEFTGEEFESEAAADAAHEHDDPENATLLDPRTKATLKGAIAEMWQAELRLRTYRPREALPYEYRALELLKSVQQASRAYVQRVGFEPPPLEPDEKRLTGKLEGIRSGVERRDSDGDAAPLAASFAVLDPLRRLARGAPPSTADRAAIESAIAELVAAEPPADDARRLQALRGMRVVAESLRVGRPCARCAGQAHLALVAALPPARPAARLPASRDALAQRYFELLRERR